jgi:hypothetical protein
MSQCCHGLKESLRTSERYSEAIAIESSIRVQEYGARNSSVGCFSEGLIAHQIQLESGITPARTNASE